MNRFRRMLPAVPGMIAPAPRSRAATTTGPMVVIAPIDVMPPHSAQGDDLLRRYFQDLRSCVGFLERKAAAATGPDCLYIEVVPGSVQQQPCQRTQQAAEIQCAKSVLTRFTGAAGSGAGMRGTDEQTGCCSAT